MIRSISFIVLTQFFHFNELKILRQPSYLFFKLNQQYFFSLLSFIFYSSLVDNYKLFQCHFFNIHKKNIVLFLIYFYILQI